MNIYEFVRLYQEKQPRGHFFDAGAMMFFGDTFENYGVRPVVIDTYIEKGVEVYELYRKKPVEIGGLKSAYFFRDTLGIVFKKD